ncbi:MAG: circadian clock protein KaiC [Chitinivibrionales bacterium]|nr:circadian clock protein KaiC [Chitinivibrionales bacterium]
MTQKLIKLSSGIGGLDAALRGGYPSGRTTLIHGETGTGKTIIGMHFLIEGAQNSEAGILISFEERADALRRNALTLGWDLAKLEKEGRLAVLDPRLDPRAVVTGEFSFAGLFALLEGLIRKLNVKRIVIDAVDVLLQLLENPARERNEIFMLHDWLLDHKLTALITMKLAGEQSYYPFVEFLTDCVVRLRAETTEHQRLLQIVKCRGSGFSSGANPYAISERGLVFHPLVDLEMSYPPITGHISTGFEELDHMMGGGYTKGGCTAIVGATGTGKTTISNTFARNACENGERVLYVNYEESAGHMVGMMKSSGIDLEPVIQKGSLKILSQMPEAVVPEIHLDNLMNAIEDHNPGYVIVDAVSSFDRMGSEATAFYFMLRLVTHCRRKGITVLLTNQITGKENIGEIFGIGYSSIIDTIVYLNYSSIGGEMNRTILIMKSRGSQHTNQFREFMITSDGIRFADIYSGKGGMLTGVARQEQEIREQQEERQRQYEVEAKKKEIERMKASSKAERLALQARIDKAIVELENLKSEDVIFDKAREQREIMRKSKDSEEKVLQKNRSSRRTRKGGQ